MSRYHDFCNLSPFSNVLVSSEVNFFRLSSSLTFFLGMKQLDISRVEN